MKTLAISILCLLWLWAAAATAVPAQDPTPPDAASEAEAPAGEGESAEGELGEEAKDPVSAALPGEHHEHLKKHLGRWAYTMRIWTSLEGEPLEIEGRAEARLLLGGRFVETVYQGQIGGDPFEARAVDGYDNLAGKYERVWQDTFGTYTLLYDGSCSEEGNVRSLTAPFQDPVSGSRLRNRVEITFLEDGTYEHKSYILAGTGEPFLNMELTATPAAE